MEIIRYGVRQLDRDNLYASMKIPIDALRDAGIIENDTEEVHHWKEQRVTIEIIEVEVEEEK